MNVKSAKKPQKRVDVNFQQRFKMQSYGADNLYPQNIMAITGASGTAQLCLNRYEKFIVVNSAGRLAPNWPEQRQLLESEGVLFKPNGNVDLKQAQWEITAFSEP